MSKTTNRREAGATEKENDDCRTGLRTDKGESEFPALHGARNGKCKNAMVAGLHRLQLAQAILHLA